MEKLACCSSSRRIWHGLGVGVGCPGPTLSPISAPTALPLTEREPCHALLRHRHRTQLPGLQAEGAQALCTRGKRETTCAPRQGSRSRTHDRRLPLVEITSTHRSQAQHRYLCASALEVTLTAASIKITCQKERMNDRQTTSYSISSGGSKSLESIKDDQSQSILYDTLKNETKTKKQHLHLKNYRGLISVTSL